MVSLTLHYPHAPFGHTRGNARTADATLAYAPPRLSPRRRFAVRSAHSCSHTRFARTLARTPWAGTRSMWCRYCSIIRTLPGVARGDMLCLYPFASQGLAWLLYCVTYTAKSHMD